MKHSPSSEANSHTANQEFRNFYETEGLLPCSQGPAYHHSHHYHSLFIVVNV